MVFHRALCPCPRRDWTLLRCQSDRGGAGADATRLVAGTVARLDDGRPVRREKHRVDRARHSGSGAVHGRRHMGIHHALGTGFPHRLHLARRPGRNGERQDA